MIKDIIKLIRPKQWLKNGFVFLPMFFGGEITDGRCWVNCVIAFFAFSFAASCIYCLNDIIDVDADRKHPKKCKRPIASGKVSIATAITLMALLFVASLALCQLFWADSFEMMIWASSTIFIYVMLNVLYCLRLKQISIIDVMIVAFGFVLRLFLGGIVCSVILSPWIVGLTFLLTLFMAFAKRRDDVLLLNEKGIVTRKNVVNYNLDFLNLTLGILAAVTIVCYIMYTVSPEVVERVGSQYLYVTSIFVIAGILRYLQIAIVKADSGSPTQILWKDRFIQSMILCWILVFIFILYV